MIYYVRHGQTESNLRKVFTGSENCSITEVGVLQAKETAEKLKNVTFDIVFCSPLKRARQTLEIILKHHKNVKVVVDERLVERDDSILEGLLISKHDADRWDLRKKDSEDYGESITHAFDRIKNFYDEILKNFPKKNILIVAHAGIGMLSKCYFYGFPEVDDIKRVYDVKNAEVVMFEN